MTVRGRILSEKKYAGTWLISEKTGAVPVELNERAEATTSSYFKTGGFLQCIYSVFVINKYTNFEFLMCINLIWQMTNFWKCCTDYTSRFWGMK